LFSDSFSQPSYNFNDGLNKAKSEKKKVLINICIDSDKWCEKMSSVYGNAKIKSIIEKYFIYVKLNAQGTEKCKYQNKEYAASELAKLFGVTGYPTHVFLGFDGSIISFKYNGEMTGNFPGYADENEFENILTYFSQNKYKDTDLSTVL
jgi:thioredoxin-related protein